MVGGLTQRRPRHLHPQYSGREFSDRLHLHGMAPTPALRASSSVPWGAPVGSVAGEELSLAAPMFDDASDASSTEGGGFAPLTARVLAPGRLAVSPQTRPAPGPGEVLVAVERAGVCGTDVHIVEGGYALARFPLVPGHELAGTVVEVGEAVRGVAVGERVTVDPNVPCLACPECRRNAFNHCERMSIVGVNRDGGFASYLVVPERAVYPVGDLPFTAAALLEPLACVLWGLKRARVEPGARALVFGAGPLGCLLVQALRFAGAATVAAVDVVPYRLEVARSLGATAAVPADDRAGLDRLERHGFDLVVDATGSPAVLQGALAYVRPGGTVWAFGVAPAEATIQVSPFELFRRDLTLFSSFALNRTFDQAIELARTPGMELEALVSHVVPLAEFERGMEVARTEPRRMKVQYAMPQRQGDR